MKAFAVLFVLLISGSGYCEGSFVISNHLLNKCQSYIVGAEDNNDERICLGYIMGVHDTAKSYEKMFDERPLYCEPPRVDADEMVLAVKKYLQANPELLHYSASSTVIDALGHAFPCD
jgi:hypothetical protein